MRADRAGAALLEVLIASVLLAIATSALVTQLNEVRAAMHATERAERDVVESSDEMERVAALDRDALSMLIGWTTRGRWSLHVERASDSLFDVALSDRPGGPPMLTTTLYRPRTADAR